MRFALLLSAAILLRAQGTPPKTSAADYTVHTQLGTVTIAAEYLVHSIPTAKGNLIAADYLVVDVAFFGPSFSRLKMSPDNSGTLRINGRGDPLSTEAEGMVAQSVKNPARSHLEAAGSVGMGDGTVSVGPRPPSSRFPGDGNERTAAPTLRRWSENTIDYRLQSAMLPEGEHSLPRSGVVCFFFRGKIKNIHSLELFYDGAMGKTSLKVLP